MWFWLLLLLGGAGQPQITPDQVALRLESRLSSLSTLQAEFQQTYYSSNVSTPLQEKGILYIRTPGWLRFDYSIPEVKIFVIKEDLYQDVISRKEKYIAYSQYTTLPSGKFRITFVLHSSLKESVDCIFEVASSRGKATEIIRKKKILIYPHKEIMSFTLGSRREIEPRIRFVSEMSMLY